MDPETDFQQWNHLCRAFRADLEMVNELYQPDGVVVVLDETGEVELADFEHPEDATYIFGRSGLNGMQNMVRCDHSVRIATPEKICLFGIAAASILLNDRVRKWRQL